MADDRWNREDEYRRRYGYDPDQGDRGWLNEYSTDWRRYADRAGPPERGYQRDFDERDLDERIAAQRNWGRAASNADEGRQRYSGARASGQRYAGQSYPDQSYADHHHADPHYDRDLPTRAYPGQRQDGLRGRDEWRHERGWWDRTKDEVRAWMGDEQAEQRREADHSGRGPKGYTRSDERIREDVSDRLMEDWGVDATDIEVTVTSGEVTLSGTVDGRESKRRAENLAAAVLGVRDVQNSLRVRKVGEYSSGAATGETAGSVKTASTAVGSTLTTPGTGRPRH